MKFAGKRERRRYSLPEASLRRAANFRVRLIVVDRESLFKSASFIVSSLSLTKRLGRCEGSGKKFKPPLPGPDAGSIIAPLARTHGKKHCVDFV